MSERLLELDREGLISKQIYPEIPPRVEFLRSVHGRLETVMTRTQPMN